MNINTNNTELKYWLALSHTPHIGSPNSFREIINTTTPNHLFERTNLIQDPNILQALEQTNWSQVNRDLEWLEEDDSHHILCYNDSRYPQLLKQIPDPPPVLYVKGNPLILNNLQLAIVGSRNPSPTGMEITLSFSEQLTQLGFTITSGLALGIDAAAHRGALKAKGTTIAVLGTGVNKIYPLKNQSLWQEICQQGALVSEFPIDTPARPGNFPQRNRIVSGLSLGTLVTEAAIQSGSLITARLATEQGREVFAIPGSIHNPMAKGCNALLKKGVKLVETIEDILCELGPLAVAHSTHLEPKNNPKKIGQAEPILLKYMGFEPTSVDTLITRSGLTANLVLSKLTLLELQGLVISAPGGYIRTPAK